jgi:hypothetical protein
MAFQVGELSIELIEALVPVLGKIQARNKALADQLSRASESIALNCGEAEFSDPGNRRARLFTAAGSAGRRARRCASRVAKRIVSAVEAQRALALVQRVVAILWRMTRG